MRRPNADYLISIRKGEVDLATIMEKCEKDLVVMNEEFDKSSLSEKVNEGLVKELITEIRLSYYEDQKKTRNT